MQFRSIRTALTGTTALAASIACLTLSPMSASATGPAAAKASPISVALDRSTAVIGSKVVLRGSVKGTAKAKRKVSLQTRDASGRWRTLENRTTKKDGSFAFPTPTWNRTHPLRVEVAASGAAAVSRSKIIRLKRTVPSNTGGSAKSWKPLFSSVTRWDACSTITVRADRKNAPGWFVNEVKSVLADNALYTGLNYRFAGTGARKDADIYLRWRTAKQVPSLRGATAGVAHTSVMGNREIVSSVISLDLDDYFYGRTFWRTVLRHEVAHAVGLNHVNDPKQRLHPTTMIGNRDAEKLSRTWGRGDIAGLKRVGASYGCL